ncbi:putative reverse transcriptase domain-containing protein [Tanacetum coccineum]
MPCVMTINPFITPCVFALVEVWQIGIQSQGYRELGDKSITGLCEPDTEYNWEMIKADQLLHHEVEGRVDILVKEVEELENQHAEVVDELVNKMIKEMTETRGREATVGMTWEDFKVLMREELCPNNELQKLEIEFWCYAMVEAGHAAYTDRFHELVRLVPHLVTPENKRIERSLKKNSEKRGNGGDPSKDGNVKGDNKRSRTKGDNMKADQLLHHEVEGQVDVLVKEVEELENQQAEVVDELVKKMVKEVQTRGREAAVGMTWEDFKALIREELCPNNEMQKLEIEFWCHAMVGAGHAAYTDRFHELVRLVPHLVTPENKRIERYIYGLASQIHGMVAEIEPATIQSAILKVGVLTDEAIRNGSLKKNSEKRGNGREPSKDGNVKGDNKRSRTKRAFPTTTNPDRKEYTGSAPKCTNCNFHHHPEMPCRMCTNCNRLGHFAKDLQGGAKSWKKWQPDTFTLNNYYATTLFNSGADYSFVSTTFISLLDIEPNNSGFSYEIEIASEQLVEINKVIRGCKLEIEGHTFDIDLIPFGHGSFDVIVGMDWLSRHKAEIVCHKKVVKIPLPHGKMLRVLGERLEEKVRHLMSAKAKEQKLKDIIVVRNFSEVFPDDLSGLPLPE